MIIIRLILGIIALLFVTFMTALFSFWGLLFSVALILVIIWAFEG